MANKSYVKMEDKVAWLRNYLNSIASDVKEGYLSRANWLHLGEQIKEAGTEIMELANHSLHESSLVGR